MKASKLGLLSGALVLGLAACDLINPPGSNGPTISSFTASPAVVDAGDTTTLSWTVDSTATSLSISPRIGAVTGTSVETSSISATTEYVLTATNAAGDSSTRSTTVTLNDGGSSVPKPPPGGGSDGPTGTFGVSDMASGPFSSDSDDTGGRIISNDDERIVTVSDGGTFYAQVQYSDPDGISKVDVLLVNSAPGGIRGALSTTEPRAGFTLAGEPTGDCSDLSSNPTEVTCVYAISVAPGTVDIEQLPDAGNEFAYVFRTEVTDALDNLNGTSNRGYVDIQ